MPLVYLVAAHGLNRVKVGGTKGDDHDIYDQYLEPYGDDMSLVIFPTENFIKIKNQFKKHFKKHHITYGLFKKTPELMDEYTKYLCEEHHLEYYNYAEMHDIANLNVFGSETLDHITSEFLDKCLMRTNEGHFELILHIHNHSKNHNVLQSAEPDHLLYFTENGFMHENILLFLTR